MHIWMFWAGGWPDRREFCRRDIRVAGSEYALQQAAGVRCDQRLKLLVAAPDEGAIVDVENEVLGGLELVDHRTC